MAEIQIQHVTKTFRDVRAVDDISLTIGDGEFMVLLGPSGCGKTTLLRSIAGLEQIDQGRILIGGRDVTDLAPRKRRLAMVFQSYAVFPHLTVFENIAFGLRMAKTSGPDVVRRVGSAAELLQIQDLLKRYPSQVSGGQRQRVAVARAIAMEPQVLLMDEPLSNLDALLRLEMRAELKRLLRELRSTTVYVTHDQVEALSMGDRIAVMRSGSILQVADPLTIYDSPVDRFVGGFIGNPPMNFLEVTIRQDGPEGALAAEVSGAGSVLIGPARDHPGLGSRAQTTVLLGIRAEHIHLAREDSPPDGLVRARCTVVEPLGSHNLLTVQVGGQQLKVAARPEQAVGEDQELWLRLDTGRIRWLDADSGQAIDTGSGQAIDSGSGRVIETSSGLEPDDPGVRHSPK
jgi:multiple sugar transport system ATP-binding protein